MTGNHGVSAPDHLYTWVDVDEYFAGLATWGQWPAWLLEVDAYWDAVVFIVDGSVEVGQLWQWLGERLGPLTVDPIREVIFLESVGSVGEPVPEAEAVLPVQVRTADPFSVDLPPRWTQRRVVRQLGQSLQPPSAGGFRDDVEICAFHSFKGGTGRTLHCLTLARELVGREGAGGVLLVDADFEAPGISWMLQAQGQRTDFSLADFLALLHGSRDGRGVEAVKLASKFLANQERDGVVVLPAIRDLASLAPLRIEPADLLTPGRSSYFFTEALADLAVAVGARTVIVDLRAGTSELSAPVLLDPRVHRVFVTTLSDQSVRGTVQVIGKLARLAPARTSADPGCSVLVTQFHAEDHETWLARVSGELSEVLAKANWSGPSEPEVTSEDERSPRTPVDQDAGTSLLSSPFDPRLLALPATWDHVGALIEAAELGSVVTRLADALRPRPETGLPAMPGVGDLSEARQRLRDVASGLVYAESAEESVEESAEEGAGFLPTDALVSLVAAHRTEVPIEVVVGAKGAGKTFTYLRACLAGSWADFARVTGVQTVGLDLPIVPVLASQNLSEALRDRLVQVRENSARLLSDNIADNIADNTSVSFLDLRETVTAALGRDLDDAGWRKVWLTCFARAAGLSGEIDTVEKALAELARRRRAVFVLDGLEDLFQQFSTDSRQQQALRVLLTSCPEWLRSLRGRPLGLIVFVRRDLVISSIRQNTEQFLARHAAFELRWNRDEALRLVAWVAERAGVLEGRSGDVGQDGSGALSRSLLPVWGEKLGSGSSREARCDVWFLAALSDFTGQIQARDVVAFLADASKQAVDDPKISARWTDRLLPPAAMRRALPACSQLKVEALSQENPPISEIFDRLRRLPVDVRKVPFTLETVSLDPAEVRLLEANGVLLREDDRYWVPEIYRYGLGFGLAGAGRPRVLAIAKLAGGRGTRR